MIIDWDSDAWLSRYIDGLSSILGLSAQKMSEASDVPQWINIGNVDTQDAIHITVRALRILDNVDTQDANQITIKALVIS